MKKPQKSRRTIAAVLMGLGMLLVVIGIVLWYPGRNYEELGGYAYFMAGFVFGFPGLILFVTGIVMLGVYLGDRKLWERIAFEGGEEKLQESELR
jgi:uncharacterized membrane protein YidH (DUF202 family)